MSHNAQAFQQLAADRNAMTALQADPQVFAAIGKNAARVRRTCWQRAAGSTRS